MRTFLPLATGAVAATVFIADTLTPPDCVVGGLYVLVVLMAGRFCSRRGLWLVSLGCAGLTVLAQFLAHRYVLENDQAAYIGAFNTTVTIVAVSLSCTLVLRGRSAEAALRRAQTDLARVSRVTTMGELTASIAHEVNQPIAGVVTTAGACVRWLASDPPDLDKARAAVARIVRDGNRAADVIARIRQIFTKGEVQRERVNINHLARETVDLLANEASRHAVTIRMDLPPEVPVVYADRVQLQQVVLNLVINGIDAMKDRGGERELTLGARALGVGQVEFSVSDTGVGLPPLPPDQLFEAFFTTKPDGTGMGLSISRSIIEAHQGRIWAKPNAPRGAIFLFSLPIGPETGADETASAAP
jgi:signal transduction histidine kinase